MLNMRVLYPPALVDLNHIPGLESIRRDGDTIKIGALTRYTALEYSPVVQRHLPLVADAVRRVADRQVRNRGTLGGSLCHADPAAQMPLCAVTLGAQIQVVGPRGQRLIAAEEFFVDAYTTAIDPLEVLVEVDYPDCGGRACAFVQHVRRHGDFVTLSVAATGVRLHDGRWTGLRIGLGGLANRPILCAHIGEHLEGTRLDATTIREAANLATVGINPHTDVRGSAEYRTHLAPIYVERVLSMLSERGERG